MSHCSRGLAPCIPCIHPEGRRTDVLRFGSNGSFLGRYETVPDLSPPLADTREPSAETSRSKRRRAIRRRLPCTLLHNGDLPWRLPGPSIVSRFFPPSAWRRSSSPFPVPALRRNLGPRRQPVRSPLQNRREPKTKQNRQTRQPRQPTTDPVPCLRHKRRLKCPSPRRSRTHLWCSNPWSHRPVAEARR